MRFRITLIQFNLLIAFFSLLSLGAFASELPEIEITIHNRVDTTNRDINAIANLWINYLKSKPDSVYDNPYWNQAEKKKYTDFDLSRKFLYQFPSEQLLRYYQPTILSIVKEGRYYAIRTLFYADGVEKEYRSSNPWCITKLYATKENGDWKLINALKVITENWSRKKIGPINFIYPFPRKLNLLLAQESVDFCKNIIEEFNFPKIESFDFYITENGDKLGKLLNFDFAFAGYSTGVGLYDKNILITGLNSEFYPHELVHMVLPKKERHSFVEEGFATWKGGTMEKTFQENARILAKQIAKNDTITFENVLNKQWGWQYAAFYTTGALFCDLIYREKGKDALKKFLETPKDDNSLINSLCSLLNIKEEELNMFWRKKLMEFTK